MKDVVMCPFRRRWTDRMLDNVTERINAPLEVIPPGMIPPPVAAIILNSPAMRRLVLLRRYLQRRATR
jgi:hypothetical protein